MENCDEPDKKASRVMPHHPGRLPMGSLRTPVFMVFTCCYRVCCREFKWLSVSKNYESLLTIKATAFYVKPCFAAGFLDWYQPKILVFRPDPCY
jgi:hypothetical protein